MLPLSTFAFKAVPGTRNTQIFVNLADNYRSDAEASWIERTRCSIEYCA
jgi:hypothetical protein